MSREIKEDFDKLKSFIESYELKTVNSNKEFSKLLALKHRKYLSFLTYIAETIYQINENITKDSRLEERFFTHARESVSDCGNAIFCWVHGAYKPASTTLRSSIENFIRSIGQIENVDIASEKNMYKVFDLAKSVSLFNNGQSKDSFTRLHGNYKILCNYVHSSDKGFMVHLSALSFFPNFNQTEAKKIEKLVVEIISDFLIILSLSFPSIFHAMHHRNKAIVSSSLPGSINRVLFGLS